MANEEPPAAAAARDALGPVWTHTQPQPYSFADEYRDDDTFAERGDLVNRWCDLPARLFSLRGPQYLSEAKTNNHELKLPSQPAPYACIGINVFQSRSDLRHAAATVASLRTFLSDMTARDAALRGTPAGAHLAGDAPEYLVYCWVFSNLWRTEYTTVVHLCRRVQPLDSRGADPADRVFGRWLAMSDEDKSGRLKYFARFHEANPSLLSTIDMLGGQRPVIIGRKLTPSYFRGENYLEVDLDVGSSKVASMLNGVALKSSGNFAFDECVCVEAQEEDELPERALFAVRWNHCTIQDCGMRVDDLGQTV